MQKLIGLTLAAGMLLLPHAARGANVWGLSVGLQAPAFTRAQHASENTPQLVWSSWVKPGWGKLKLFSNGQFSTRDSSPWWTESKANVGMEYPLNDHFTAYTFAEDRFRLDQWRYVAGVRFTVGG